MTFYYDLILVNRLCGRAAFFFFFMADIGVGPLLPHGLPLINTLKHLKSHFINKIFENGSIDKATNIKRLKDCDQNCSVQVIVSSNILLIINVIFIQTKKYVGAADIAGYARFCLYETF